MRLTVNKKNQIIPVDNYIDQTKGSPSSSDPIKNKSKRDQMQMSKPSVHRNQLVPVKPTIERRQGTLFLSTPSHHDGSKSSPPPGNKQSTTSKAKNIGVAVLKSMVKPSEYHVPPQSETTKNVPKVDKRGNGHDTDTDTYSASQQQQQASLKAKAASVGFAVLKSMVKPSEYHVPPQTATANNSKTRRWGLKNTWTSSEHRHSGHGAREQPPQDTPSGEKPAMLSFHEELVSKGKTHAQQIATVPKIITIPIFKPPNPKQDDSAPAPSKIKVVCFDDDDEGSDDASWYFQKQQQPRSDDSVSSLGSASRMQPPPQHGRLEF